jgi:ubiquinone/menaquinone biosynthesis C-methylase UbiE
MTQIFANTQAQQQPAIDPAAIKSRQQAMWASGDFAVIGTTLQIVGETLCEAVDLEAGTRVLDVACGNGNAALAAARRWCRVTGVDYVPSLLEAARRRAAAEELHLTLIEGDAEALPFPDGAFDVALSTYGIMFAPDQPRAAAEIMRVVRRGGTIGLANWTPDGFAGQLLVTVGKHVAPPTGVASPTRWGGVEHLEKLFEGAASIQTARREFVFRYESTEHFIEVFRRFYGPTYKAFQALDRSGQARLAADIAAVAARFNRAERSFIVPGEYLEVVIER